MHCHRYVTGTQYKQLYNRRCVSTSTPAKVNSSHVQQRPGRFFVNQTGDGSDFITNHQEPLAINRIAAGKTFGMEHFFTVRPRNTAAVTQKLWCH